MENPTPTKQLHLGFHGRIIDQLGIQMYQSPVAAIAEMISNAWDADAKQVAVTLPTHQAKRFVVSDNGRGMTFDQCQQRFLTAGYDTRKGDPSARSPNGRILLGRKGIGKFAGFGLSKAMTVDTISEETGEHTTFRLLLDEIRGNGKDYVITTAIPVEVLKDEGPDESRKAQHGTIITLEDLTISKTPSPEEFRKSMARRFTVHQSADDFAVLVEEKPIPDDDALGNVRYSFPRDYTPEQKPIGLHLDGDWGIENVAGQEIRWRFRFLEAPIDEEELRGITIFAEKKMAQKPFFFNITGGVWGQGGLEYMTGQVIGNYLDHFQDDIIAAERQRINWDDARAAPLLEWGQRRVKELAGIWADLRREAKYEDLESKVSSLGNRLDKFPIHEQGVVRKALTRLADVPRMSEDTFSDVSNAMITAWERGRLKDLIHSISSVGSAGAGEVLALLVEADVLTALNIAEAVKTRLSIIQGLKDRIKERELENSIRDYLAEHPWLLSPDWERFEKELSVSHMLEAAALEVKLDTDPDWNKRIDLTLSGGRLLIIVEFMRPGLRIDRDHLTRFEYYIDVIRNHVRANTGGRFDRVEGLLVADGANKTSGAYLTKLEKLANDGLVAVDWADLAARSERQWREFLFALRVRTPKDPRLDDFAALELDPNALQEPTADTDPTDEGTLPPTLEPNV